jgi:hypothetical protein
MVAGGVFQWERVFEAAGKVEEAATGCEGGTRGREEVPVKMEICSGTGDWVVAQEQKKKVPVIVNLYSKEAWSQGLSALGRPGTQSLESSLIVTFI